VNRDYLIAVAWVESQLKNVVNPKTGAMGPFQFMRDTWAGLVAQHGQQEDITERDIADAGKQAVFAAISTAEAQDRLLGKLGQLPTGAELYVAHLLGLPAALGILSADRATPIDQALLPVFQRREDPVGLIRKIIENNKSLLTAGDRVKTIEEILTTIVDRLNEGLRQAARIAALLPEDEQFAPRLAGEEGAPWMIVAREELRRRVTEDKRPGRSEPRIEEYHATTTGGRQLARLSEKASLTTW
jgi:hypothetical protein